MVNTYTFEEIVANCMEDASFRENVLLNPAEYNLSEEECELLMETDFDTISFQIDERNALSALSMWAGTVA